MNKELKEMNEMLDKMIEKLEKFNEEDEDEEEESEESKKEAKEDIKKATKEIEKQLKQDNQVLIFANQNGSLVVGKTVDVLASLCQTIDNLKDTIDFEVLSKSIISALICDDNKKEIVIDRDKMNELLDNMKDLL